PPRSAPKPATAARVRGFPPPRAQAALPTSQPVSQTRAHAQRAVRQPRVPYPRARPAHTRPQAFRPRKTNRAYLCRSFLQTSLQLDDRTPDPAFPGTEWHFHPSSKLFVGIAVEERAAQRLAFVFSKTLDAALQLCLLLGVLQRRVGVRLVVGELNRLLDRLNV